MIERFKELVAESSFLTLMIDKPTEVSHDSCQQLNVENGVHYLWDGYIPCVVLFDGESYWDLQDCWPDVPDRKLWWKYAKYSSLEELVRTMEEQCNA